VSVEQTIAGARMSAIGDLDPVTFEVIRHRLWAINDDQGRLAARLSGSPIVYEVFDLNAALITADGRGLYSGVYLVHHAATIDIFVRKILDEWPRDQIRRGDMFFTNDPWSGALHANDGILVMPFFYEDQIVGWGGVVMHDSDVGSPVPGSFVVGSEDRYGEAPLFPLVRMVEDYRLREDIEGVYLRNSRTPQLNAVNVRARLAALTVTEQRIGEVIEQYGIDAFLATQEGILAYAETAVRARLRQIPDGTWFDHLYHDHNGNTNEFYAIHCRLTKRDDSLTVDFTGTAQQAVGGINCARPAMEGAVLGVFMTFLCYDLPWSVAAARDVVEIISEPGTLNNAISPAGVSMASVTACLSTQDIVSNVYAKMLMSSPALHEEAQGVWSPGINCNVYAGIDRRGESFTESIMDCMSGGGGARAYTDGIDTGSILQSMSGTMPNVETTESRTAILQIYRRERCDSAGAGRFRGGVGAEWALIPHKCKSPLIQVAIASGASQPGADGIAGGDPTPVVSNLVLRDTDVHEQFAQGIVPFTPDAIRRKRVDKLAAKDQTVVGAADVAVSFCNGGCGYGDPTRRDPQLVARDVRHGLVSEIMARTVYGVIVVDGSVDGPQTEEARHAIRRERIAQGTPVDADAPGGHVDDGELLHPVADAVEAVAVGDRRLIRCSVCRQRLSAYDEEYKRGTLMRELPITHASPLNERGLVDEFVLREFCCPGCGTALAVNVQRSEEPVWDEARFGI
jgi:N-methylhydantoinase B/oxoprolinase/acetone carboxylase alpha subunit